MAQEKNVTPEKQLLQLIEDPKKNDNLKTAAIKHRGMSFFAPAAWLGRFSFFKGRVKVWSHHPGEAFQIDIKLINNLLFLSMLILAFYVTGYTYTSIMHLKKGFKIDFEAVHAGKAKTFQAATLLKAASYYLEKARQRDIFKMVVQKKEPGQDVGGPSARLMEATQDLRIVGISWSKDPDAMIENTKTRATYFLKKGNVFNNIKVEAIFKDKVVLSFEGEEIELQ